MNGNEIIIFLNKNVVFYEVSLSEYAIRRTIINPLALSKSHIRKYILH
jgi:hypothetical protein